ncbi:MAG: hypothetical protein ACRDVG_14245, partial [Jatrophihabitantaceae bacterium]
MTTSSTLLTALVAAATAVVVAVLTQLVTWRRERSERTYERRRAALIDAQDAALALRNRFATYGALSRSAFGSRPDTNALVAQRQVDDSLAAFDVRLTRVDDTVVVGAARHWRESAGYHSISDEEVTAGEEGTAWAAMNADFGAALMSATGRAPVS